jgi:two-component system OmpR family sensor kinase
MRRLSLRARLLLGVVVLAGLGLVVADVVTYRELRSYLVGQVDTTLQQDHLDALSILSQPGATCNDLRRLGPDVFVRVETANQSRTICTQALGEQFGGSELPAQPKVPDAISLQAVGEHGPLGFTNERLSYLTVPAASGGGQYRLRASREGNVVLVVGRSLHEVESILHRLFLVELFVTLAVLGALVALGLWVVQLGLRPLRRIEDTAKAITAGDLSQRVADADPQTEVGRVGSALNTMLDHIETSDRRLRRFVADASHELRTPLAAVRAYAELFGRGASARPADLERSMSGITRETERMSLLVDDLLLLARLDEGRPLEQEPVDLAAVVGQAVDAARVVEPDRPIELSSEPATVAGDAARLRQVLDNLLANARAHTPEGTPVAVGLHRADGKAELTVADRGPGLSEEQAARVFERFYRADSSRTRASGGTGLGLSIVAAVTEAHGGRAEARPTPGGGATFAVTLPLAATDERPPR